MIGPAEIEEMMAEYAETLGQDDRTRLSDRMWPTMAARPSSMREAITQLGRKPSLPRGARTNRGRVKCGPGGD